MVAKKHLIIGAGPAALSALVEIRQVNSEDEVKLVSMEDYLPYSPAALIALLTGKITEAELWRKDENYFRNLRSTLVRGKEVTQILPEKKRVIYRDGSSESYDTLLIASGSEPIKPPIEGLEEMEVHDLRTLANCQHLLQKLKGRSNVVIIGAGLVGMNIATALLEKGCRISIIEREQSILPLNFNDEAEVYIRDIFTHNKCLFFTGKVVTAAERKDGEMRIVLSDGSSIDVDILINAIGVKGRVSFLEGTGIKIKNGILVNRRMSTGVDNIYAAGDVAEAQDFFSNKTKMNATIPSAVNQGRVAGANMAGGYAEYEGGIPMAALNFLGNKAFSIGLPKPLDLRGQILKQKDEQKKKFKKLVFDGDRLVGGMFLNEEMDPGIILHLIKERVNLVSHKEALFEGTKPLTNPWLSSLKFRPY